MNYLLKILKPGLWALVLLNLTSCDQSNIGESPEFVSSYHFQIDSSDLKKVTVTAEFELADSILYMGYGATMLPDRWATFVEKMEVLSDQGEILPVEKMPDAQWKVNGSIGEKVTLKYEVLLNHEDYDWSSGIDGIAYSTDWGVFYTGRSLFVLNEGVREEIQLTFNLPDTWKVTTPWEESGLQNHSFTATSATELEESMIFAGQHEEIILQRDDFELIFALGGEKTISEKDQFRSLAEGVLDYYIDLFNSTPKTSPDNPIKKVLVVINPGESSDGEVIGNSISILIEKDGDQMSEYIAKFIFAHEFFHLWNGKSFFPSDENAEWFKEGFTNYYTLKSLRQVGVLSDTSFFDFVSNFFYERYRTDDGLGSISMSNGEAKHDHWGIVYGGGLMTAFCQDITIRLNTDNQASLDDVFVNLFETYAGSNDSYTVEELKQLFSKYSQSDQSAFIEAYIEGSEKVPVEDFFTQLGLNASLDQEGRLIIDISGERNELQEKALRGVLGELKG